jgi:hypothetical protein
MAVENVRRCGTGSPKPRYRGATQKTGREACSRPAHESPDSPGWRPGVAGEGNLGFPSACPKPAEARDGPAGLKLEPVVDHQNVTALLEADDD